MNVIKELGRAKWILSIGFISVLPLIRAVKAEPNPSVPTVVQTGLAVYTSGGIEPALGVWRKGGPLEGDKKAAAQADDLKQMEKPLGNYKSYELIETKEIGKTSKIIYLSMNFERGAIYASFQVYRTNKDWVVQNMEFHTKPEIIMPWLASGPGK